MKNLLTIIFLCVGFVLNTTSVIAQEVTPTENLLAYMSELLDDNTLGDDELIALLESAHAKELSNPISYSRTGIAIETAYDVIEQILPEDPDYDFILKWIDEKSQDRERVKKARKKVRKRTKTFFKIQTNSIAAGADHTCAIRAVDRKAQCWGCNIYGYGQTNVPSNLGEVQALVGGNWHTCAIKVDGYVQCWGNVDSGRTDVPNSLGEVQALASGDAHNCAIKVDGYAQCWGRNYYGQTDVPNDLGPVQTITAGYCHTCAIRADGTVQCWGSNDYDQTNVPSGLGSAQAITAGADHTCAIKVDGTVQCWGNNNYDKTDVPSDLGPVQDIVAGNWHMCAVKANNAVQCWGDNYGGKLDVPKGLRVFVPEDGQ